jgi:hypothetical protein
MKANDVYYKQRSEADHSWELKRLDEFMETMQLSDIATVYLTITLRMAIDRAYNAGLEAGYY